MFLGDASAGYGGPARLSGGAGTTEGGAVFFNGGSTADTNGAELIVTAGTPTSGGSIALSPGDGYGGASTGNIVMKVPTADPHVAGAVWSNLGILTISAG
jgi:hypothetical protein